MLTLCSIMYWDFTLEPKGLAKLLVVNWQIMAACTVNPSTSEKLPLCIVHFLDKYKYFGHLKGANEVNREYFQQATVFFCVLCFCLAAVHATTTL